MQTFIGTVLETRMVMRVQLDGGKVVSLPGNAPQGSLVELQAQAVLADASILGYKKHTVLARATRLAGISAKADAASAETAIARPRPLVVYS